MGEEFPKRKDDFVLEAIYQRELKLIEALSMAMNMWVANVKSIAKIIFILFLPISILNVLSMNQMENSLLALMQMAEGILPQSGYMAVSLAYLGTTLLQAAVTFFLEPVGIIAIAKIGKGYLYGNPITIKDAVGESMSCLGNVISASVPCFLAFVIGTLLFVIPAIYLGGIWAFYVYAIGLRDEKGLGALRYSKELVKGRWWRTFGSIFVAAIMASSISWILSGIYLFGTENIAIDILYYTLTYFSVAFVFMFKTVLFLNREAICLGKTMDKNVAEKESILPQE